MPSSRSPALTVVQLLTRLRTRTLAATCVAVMLCAGCVAAGVEPSGTTAPADVSDQRGDRRLDRGGTASIVAGVGDQLTGPPAAIISPPDTGPSDSVPGRDDPERAAAAIILDGIAAEGLLVTALDTEPLTVDGRHATIVVTVAHSAGHGHPTQSRYELDLAYTAEGWRLTRHREQP